MLILLTPKNTHQTLTEVYQILNKQKKKAVNVENWYADSPQNQLFLMLGVLQMKIPDLSRQAGDEYFKTGLP